MIPFFPFMNQSNKKTNEPQYLYLEIEEPIYHQPETEEKEESTVEIIEIL